MKALSIRSTALALTVLCAPSCDTIRTTDASDTRLGGLGSKAHAGNFYFLPKVMVKITGNYLDDGNTYEIKLTRQVEADSSRRLFAEYRASMLADDKVTYMVNGRGLIDGAFTTMSEDQTGAMLKSLATTAINVWKIGSYGPINGQINPPTAPSAAPGPKANEKAVTRKLKAFEKVFDPYSAEAINGIKAGDFTIRIVNIAGSPATQSSVPVTREQTKAKAKVGLVFRAPEVVDLSIQRTPNTITVDPIVVSADKSTPGAEAAGDSPAAVSDLGEATAPDVTNLQKDEMTWTIKQADTSSQCDVGAAVKTADRRPGAEVAFSFKRAAFVKKGTGLAFVNGELMGMNIVKPSELLAFVSIPEKITTDVLAAIPQVIGIKDYRTARDVNQSTQPEQIQTAQLNAQTALLTAQTAQLNAQVTKLTAQAALDAKVKELEKLKKEGSKPAAPNPVVPRGRGGGTSSS